MNRDTFKNTTEYLVWGLPKGETQRYNECLLLSCGKSLADCQKVIDAATKDGWHGFRVSTFNGEAPDFAKTLAV